MNNNARKIFLITIVIVFIGFVSFLIFRTSKAKQAERDFIGRNLTGKIIGLKDRFRGNYKLTIEEYQAKKMFEYTLQISWFVKENNISIGDSINKSSHGTTKFYKKGMQGHFEYCCELQYY